MNRVQLGVVLAAMALAQMAAGQDAGVVVIDNGESAEASSKIWSAAGVTIEPSAEHATGCKGCLKLTFAKDGGQTKVPGPLHRLQNRDEDRAVSVP